MRHLRYEFVSSLGNPKPASGLPGFSEQLEKLEKRT
jgi:hypothetical protein